MILIEVIMNSGSLIKYKHIVRQMQYIGHVMNFVFFMYSFDTCKIICNFRSYQAINQGHSIGTIKGFITNPYTGIWSGV